MARVPSRRRFLTQSAVGAAGVLGATAGTVSAQSQARVAGANRRVRVALIGCGGMGYTNLRDMLTAFGEVYQYTIEHPADGRRGRED